MRDSNSKATYVQLCTVMYRGEMQIIYTYIIGLINKSPDRDPNDVFMVSYIQCNNTSLASLPTNYLMRQCCGGLGECSLYCITRAYSKHKIEEEKKRKKNAPPPHDLVISFKFFLFFLRCWKY